VAELADAPDSKSGDRKIMRVRFSPSVFFTTTLNLLSECFHNK
jgi:hypothetical protein